MAFIDPGPSLRHRDPAHAFNLLSVECWCRHTEQRHPLDGLSILVQQANQQVAVWRNVNHSLKDYNVVATQVLGSIRDALLRRASELSLGRFLPRSVTFVSPLPLEMGGETCVDLLSGKLGGGR